MRKTSSQCQRDVASGCEKSQMQTKETGTGKARKEVLHKKTWLRQRTGRTSRCRRSLPNVVRTSMICFPLHLTHQCSCEAKPRPIFKGKAVEPVETEDEGPDSEMRDEQPQEGDRSQAIGE